jgi:hypothetical protein
VSADQAVPTGRLPCLQPGRHIRFTQGVGGVAAGSLKMLRTFSDLLRAARSLSLHWSRRLTGHNKIV